VSRDRREITQRATATYFTDAAGVDWRVHDLERVAGRVRPVYPGRSAAPIARVFVRRLPDEHRRYAFPSPCRRPLCLEALEAQLAAAVRRAHS
jgi:hypothetical protein